MGEVERNARARLSVDLGGLKGARMALNVRLRWNALWIF